VRPAIDFKIIRLARVRFEFDTPALDSEIREVMIACACSHDGETLQNASGAACCIAVIQNTEMRRWVLWEWKLIESALRLCVLVCFVIRGVGSSGY
jgi:hypothetical protein